MMAMLLRNHPRCWFNDEEGQTLTEYALILVLIAIVAIFAVTGLGEKIFAVFTKVTSSLPS